MKFDGLNLNEIFRFAITGIGFYFVFFFSDIEIEKRFSSIEKPLIILLMGILIYYLYRTVIYPIILKMIDRFNPNNIRNYIGKASDIEEWDEKNDLWLIICNSNSEKLDIDKSRTWSHSIHMMYIVGMLSLIGTIINTAIKFSLNKAILFFILFAVFMFAAIKSELSIEKRIYRNFVFNRDPEIDNMVQRYKENKKTINCNST